jgi:hypothetical protein
MPRLRVSDVHDDFSSLPRVHNPEFPNSSVFPPMGNVHFPFEEVSNVSC